MPKITINFLKNKIDYSGKYPVLIWKGEPRTPKIIAKYKVEKAMVTKEWVSFKDYIQVKFLKYEKTDGMKGDYVKNCAIKTEKSLEFCLEKNNFPYRNFKDRFEHNILWIDDDQDIEKALNFAFEEYKGRDYIYFQNSLQNQSVKGVTHFHFLTLKKIICKVNLKN